jgi:hypothetical protein
MNTKFLTAAVLAFGVSFGAQASLTSSGPLTVFDSGQNLTWTKDANLSGTTMDWTTAVAWANNLDYAGYTDWVLPTITQLTNQFSANLGEAAGSSIADSHNDSYNLFTNVQSYVYWSGSEYAPDPDLAWTFHTGFGLQGPSGKANQYYAWAVRPGDVAAVPVPGAFWLFGSALVALTGLKRRGSIG